MNKEILRQYTDMQQEIKDLARRIEQKETLIRKMEQRGYKVKDTVKGTRLNGTIGSITIEGFPEPDYHRQKTLLRNSKMRMQLKQEELLELTNKVEEFINNIKDARIRRIFRYRYLDDLTWVQVAHRMGKKLTADGCRMLHDRFLEKI